MTSLPSLSFLQILLSTLLTLPSQIDNLYFFISVCLCTYYADSIKYYLCIKHTTCMYMVSGLTIWYLVTSQGSHSWGRLILPFSEVIVTYNSLSIGKYLRDFFLPHFHFYWYCSSFKSYLGSHLVPVSWNCHIWEIESYSIFVGPQAMRCKSYKYTNWSWAFHDQLMSAF